MGRWLSVADPSPTTGRCEVEKKLPKGALQEGFPSPQPSGWWRGAVVVVDGNRRCAGEKGEV